MNTVSGHKLYMLRLVRIIPNSKVHGQVLKAGERIVMGFDCSDEDFAPVVAVCKEDTRAEEAVPEDAVGVRPACDAGGVQGLTYKWNEPKAHVIYNPFRYNPVRASPNLISYR